MSAAPAPAVAGFPKADLPSPTHEEFRAWELSDRKRTGVPVLVMSGLLILLLGILDLAYFTGSPLMVEAIVARGALVLLSLVAAWRVHVTQRPEVVDRWIFGWSMALVLALALRHALGGDLPPAHHNLDVVLTFVWLTFPNPLKLQLIPSVITVVSALGTPWGAGHPANVTGAYGMALLSGVLVAWDRHRTALSRFKAASEIRTLRGIIPICASCKQIRDDQGYWRRVEEYVRDHTEAEFSHGMCPDCLKEQYGFDSRGNES